MNDKEKIEDFYAVLILSKENEELKQRIDKAIEYLKAMQNSDLIFTAICEKELLEILGDKENE